MILSVVFSHFVFEFLRSFQLSNSRLRLSPALVTLRLTLVTEPPPHSEPESGLRYPIPAPAQHRGQAHCKV